MLVRMNEPGAVGALGVADVEAGLAEQRRLLVARDAGHRQLEVEEGPRVGDGELAPARHQLGQRVPRDAEQGAELVAPVAGGEVEEQGARGVGDVGDVLQAARHPRHEVGVDRADGVAPGLDEGPRVRLVLGEPGELRAREVRVEPEAGELGDALLVAGVAQPRADVGRPAVLPDDRAARGAEGLAVPEDDGLALVGDADAPQLAAVDLRQRLPRGLERRLPDLLGRVLDPAGPGEVLGELLVAPGDDLAGRRDDDRGDARGAGVDREDGAGTGHRVDRTMSSTCWSIQARSGATRIS